MSLLYEASENGRISAETLGVLMAVYLKLGELYTRRQRFVRDNVSRPVADEMAQRRIYDRFRNELHGCENNAPRGYSEAQTRWMISYHLRSLDPRLKGYALLGN